MDVRLLQELIECSVCLERMGPNSRVLPCQHTFCLPCLEAISRTRSELRCPECRAVVGVPVSELPPNILLIRLLESMKSAGHPADAAVAVSPAGGCGSTERLRRAGGREEDLPNRASSHRNAVEGIRPQPSAKAMHNYEGLQSGDLSLKRGDVVALQKQIDDNWFYGECNGKSGFFPSAFVQVVSPLPTASPVSAATSAATAPRGRALYDFHLNAEEEKDCLRLKKDDVVTVIRRVDSNWLEGQLGERVGIFPASYVILNEAAKSLVASSSTTAAAASVEGGVAQTRHCAGSSANQAAVKRAGRATTHPNRSLPDDSRQSVSQPVCAFSVFAQTGVTSTHGSKDSIGTPPPSERGGRMLPAQRYPETGQPHRVASLLPAGQVNDVSLSTAAVATAISPALSKRSALPQAGIADAPTSATACDGAEVTKCAPLATVAAMGQKCVPIYVAVFNYKSQRDDEIALEKGQLYKVTDVCRDGWYRGMSLVSGQVGVFPGNYVQAVISLPKLSTVEQKPTACGRVPSQRTDPLSPPVSRGRSAVPLSVEPKAASSSPPARSSTTGSVFRAPQPVVRQETKTNREDHVGVSRQLPPWACSSPVNVAEECTLPPPPPPPPRKRREPSGIALMKAQAGNTELAATLGVSQRSAHGGVCTSLEDASAPAPVAPASASSSSPRPTQRPAAALKTGGVEAPLERYRCVAAYPPQSEAELELQAGDVVLVKKDEQQEGWYRGIHQGTNKCGLFPASFVEKC